jgi:hypothetical protein
MSAHNSTVAVSAAGVPTVFVHQALMRGGIAATAEISEIDIGIGTIKSATGLVRPNRTQPNIAAEAMTLIAAKTWTANKALGGWLLSLREGGYFLGA